MVFRRRAAQPMRPEPPDRLLLPMQPRVAARSVSRRFASRKYTAKTDRRALLLVLGNMTAHKEAVI